MTSESVRDLAALVDGRLVGDGAVLVRGVADLRSAGPEHVGFVREPRYADLAARSAAGCVVVTAELDLPIPQIVVRDAHVAFARIAARFHPPPRAGVHAVHPSAVVHPDAVIEEPVRIEPNATIGRGVRIGAGSVIGANTVIGDDARIGRDCSIYARVVIYDRVELGDRVIVHSGTVIGADGFGYANHDGQWLKVPQVGDVRIADDVEIGANCAIDRGALGSTRIGRGTKIDNLVHVGHNCEIGENCAVAGFSAFAGTTTIGDRVTIAGHVITSGHIKIGSDVRIGGNSGLMDDVPGPGDFMGFPVQTKSRWLRTLLALDKLPELHAKARRSDRDGAAPNRD